jgi:hypothetical protein
VLKVLSIETITGPMDGFLSVSGGSVSADNNGVQQLVKAAAADYSKYAPKALLDDNNTNKLFKPKIDPKEAFFQNINKQTEKIKRLDFHQLDDVLYHLINSN